MPMYDGTTDPREHILTYKQRMMTIPVPKHMREASLCKGFDSTVIGPALKWLTSLPNGCITSFAHLDNMFNQQFASSRCLEKQTRDLYRVVQRPDKPLKDYIARFIREKVIVPECDVPTAIEAFRQGLYGETDLWRDLIKYPCKTFVDAQAKEMAQVKLEETLYSRKGTNDYTKTDMRLPYPKRSKDRPAPYSPPQHVAVVEEDDDPDWKNSPDLPQRINEYSFCGDTVGLMNHLSKMGKAVQWPPKSSKPDSKKDPSKWCDFHADIGHTTNECVALRREVAYLLKNGYLKDVIEETRSREPDRQTNPSCSREISNPLSFDEFDAGDISDKHHDGLVISIPVGNCMIKRHLVDNGSSTNVMMLDALKEMGLNPDTNVVKKSTILIGFSGEAKTTFGEVTLPVYAQGVNQQLDEVILDPAKPERVVFIGCDVPDNIRSELITNLKANADYFAWSHEDMPGISSDVITHKLSVDPHHKPVKQKRWKFAPERNQIINDEVQQLLDTGKIREVKYPDWLANIVIVRKKNGK
ncbi:uncharacterized protein [Spinacia oleracea]|uniref:Retrotransposon gag domain-containing protein n=1 Tax=Spinacia oleracea TaxID=3562 RepID=A0ABM3RQJ2_SPIOL|nr:uncharacterized protein LOC110800615 [Spinacia oleracea]